jgi:hypothetical protein
MKRSPTKEHEERWNELAVSTHQIVVEMRQQMAAAPDAPAIDPEKLVRMIVRAVASGMDRRFARERRRPRLPQERLEEIIDQVTRRVLLLDGRPS